MKTQIKILIIIISIIFSYQYTFSQILEKGMTKEEVIQLCGKPKKIIKGTIHKEENWWEYGKDTTLYFENEKLSNINYPHKNYYKRLNQEQTNDTLKYCSLYVFFYDTIKNKYLNTKPGIGTFSLKNLQNLELRAFYKTPNSYQKIDSIKWSIACDIGGFTETAWSFSSFFTKFQINRISMTMRKSYKNPNFFLFVNTIKLKSGYIIEYPKMENERFILHKYINYKSNYVKLKYVKVKTFDEALRIKKLKSYNKQPMLVYKLIK